MLKEFEEAVRGMKSGESKTFPLAFPADYHGKEHNINFTYGDYYFYEALLKLTGDEIFLW